MKVESPAPGEGAGLAEGTIITTAITAESPSEFPSPYSGQAEGRSDGPPLGALDYRQIIRVRNEQAHARPALALNVARTHYMTRKALMRFCRYCRNHGLPFDEDQWLYLLASTIRALGGWVWVQFDKSKPQQKISNPALDRIQLRKWCRLSGWRDVPPERLQRAEDAALAEPRKSFRANLWPQEIGERLGLTAAVLDTTRFWTAEAIDESTEDRKARKRREANERKAIQRRIRREACHASGEVTPRAVLARRKDERQDIVESIMARHGIGKATVERWFRDGRPETADLEPFRRRKDENRKVPSLKRSESCLTKPEETGPFYSHPADLVDSWIDAGFAGYGRRPQD